MAAKMSPQRHTGTRGQTLVPMTPKTDLYLGSTAKLFTAAAALQLAEQGRLDLDADVNAYLKHFRIRSTFPVVVRPSSARWASAARARGNS